MENDQSFKKTKRLNLTRSRQRKIEKRNKKKRPAAVRERDRRSKGHTPFCALFTYNLVDRTHVKVKHNRDIRKRKTMYFWF